MRKRAKRKTARTIFRAGKRPSMTLGDFIHKEARRPCSICDKLPPEILAELNNGYGTTPIYAMHRWLTVECNLPIGCTALNGHFRKGHHRGEGNPRP